MSVVFPKEETLAVCLLRCEPVEVVRSKGDMALMVHEGFVADDEAVATAPNPAAQVVVFIAASAVSLVEAAKVAEHRTPHDEAEPDQPVRVTLRTLVLSNPLSDEQPSLGSGSVVCVVDELASGNEVRARSRGSDSHVLIHRDDERVEPSSMEDGVVVQEHDVGVAGPAGTEVAARAEADVCGTCLNLHPWEPLEASWRLVAGSVVDNNDLVVHAQGRP